MRSMWPLGVAAGLALCIGAATADVCGETRDIVSPDKALILRVATTVAEAISFKNHLFLKH